MDFLTLEQKRHVMIRKQTFRMMITAALQDNILYNNANKLNIRPEKKPELSAAWYGRMPDHTGEYRINGFFYFEIKPATL
jgi:hypothetical protein